MNLPPFTPIPNALLDQHLRHLKESELKVLLTIMRKTYGWVDPATGKRKEKDWIAHSQFKEITGLCHKSVSTGVALLIEKDIIIATDTNDYPLGRAEQRRDARRVSYAVGGGLFQAPVDVIRWN